VTHLTLTHRGLAEAVRHMHDEGWEKFLAQLALAAERGRA
jgi:hypothetical protein